MSTKRILTGLRANGELHLGSYLGAILPMVNLQKRYSGNSDYQLNMFAPNLHSFTTEVDHSQLYSQMIENFKVFMAAGLDINQDNTFVYRQSEITAHSELCVILDNFAYFGELSRMTEYKDKATRSENVTAGLFNYPVLMAADILLYGATYVPVGDDQRQHLELTRDLAQRLNNKFEQELFTIPVAFKEQLEFYSRDTGLRIRSLRSPENKMSKSISDPAGTILLSDSPEEARKKIMSATTDSVGAVHYDFDTQPGVSNLLQILATITNESQSAVNSEWEGNERYGDLKQATADATANFLESFQERLSNVDESQLLEKLEQGEAAMREVANATLLRVQKAVGLKPVY